MQIDSDILQYDFQGWPVYKRTLRELLEQLNFERMENEGNVYWRIADNNPILDLYPRTLEDDGGGYGINEALFTEVGIVTEKDVPKYINFFIEHCNE